jgi:hypothetical protein
MAGLALAGEVEARISVEQGVAPALERPKFADNQKLTMAEAIRGHLEWLQQTWAKPVSLGIATGYFNPAGLALFGGEAGKVRAGAAAAGRGAGVAAGTTSADAGRPAR